VLEVDADARPGGGAPAHRVDEDIGRMEMSGDLWMTQAPVLECGECFIFLRRARDLDQRLR